MRKKYDFSKGRRNPHATRLKRRVALRLDVRAIEYFKGLARESGISYLTLISLYLRNCAATRRRLSLAG